MPHYVLITAALEESTYTREYIALLIRQGKVDGYKVGGTWMVNPDSLKEYEQRMTALGTKKHAGGKHGEEEP